MSPDQGVTDLIRQQTMERDITKQELVPCRKLDEKAKRLTHERYVLIDDGISINKELGEPISSEIPIKFM